MHNNSDVWINEAKDVEMPHKLSSTKGKFVAITIITHLASRVNANDACEVLMFESLILNIVVHIQIHGHHKGF